MTMLFECVWLCTESFKPQQYCALRKYVTKYNDYFVVCLGMHLANTLIQLYLHIWLCPYNNTINKTGYLQP